MNKLHNPLKGYGGIRCLFLGFIHVSLINQSVGIIVTRECIAQKNTILSSIVTGVQSTFTLLARKLERNPAGEAKFAEPYQVTRHSELFGYRVSVQLAEPRLQANILKSRRLRHFGYQVETSLYYRTHLEEKYLQCVVSYQLRLG